MRQIAEGTWVCGDPGMQFDTTINDWHTCPNTARINASNPCSRVHVPRRHGVQPVVDQPDEVRATDGRMPASSTSIGFEKACRTMILAQEILVDNASYPTPAIEKNSHDYRPLGLGYANLGALLMSRGLPYDSDARPRLRRRRSPRSCTARLSPSRRGWRATTAVRSPATRRTASRCMRVMRKHRAALKDIDRTHVPKDLLRGGQDGVGRSHRAGRAARLPQRAGDRARADRHDRLHDGLRHDRRRAGHRAGQVQEARRRRDDEDRQPDRADGAEEARLQPAADQGDHRVHRRERDDRGRAAHQGAAPRGVRLRVQADARRRARSTTWGTSR